MEKLRLNIQKFAGATISGSSTASNCNCRIVWTSTTQGSTVAEKSQLNKSNVTATIQIYKSGSSSTTGTFSGSITINGKSTSVSKKFSPYNWGSWATVGSVTVSGIEHNADGKKSISISGTLTQGGTSMAGTYKASGTAVLDTINRLSTITSVTKTTIDKPFSITFPDYGLYYDLNVGYLNPETFTGYNVLEVRDVKNNTNYSIPSASIPDLYREFTGSGGIDLWAALKIYADEARTQPIYTNSTQDAWEAIGINFGYGNIPPTASITLTGEQNTTMKNLNWGIYVQGKSQIGVQINGTAQYGATITGRSSSTNGITYNQASYTTGAITASGDNLVKARVTDSRGQQSAEASSSYYVYPYAQPSVTLHSAERCDANGNVKDNGTYLRIAFSSNIYACNNKNAKSVSVYAGNYSSVISTSYSNSQTVSIVNANLSSSASYDIQLKATDSFTEVVSNTIRLSTSDLADIFHFHKSGKSMAIGGKSTANDSDKNLEVYMKSSFSEKLTNSKGNTCVTLNGGGGTAGYMKACTLEINQAYANQWLVFHVIQRDRLGTIYLMFNSGDTLDPGINSFVKDGGIEAYIVKENTSRWTLYIQKSEAWDNIEITQLEKGTYSDPKINITWVGSTSSTLPSGYVQATLINKLLNIKGNAATATRATTATNVDGGYAWVPGGILSHGGGYENTPIGNGELSIKKAYASNGAPNNGVILEFGNSTSWVGQLYIGDNATQGIYYNGWSDGARGSWKRLQDQLSNTTGSGIIQKSSGNVTVNSSSYARYGNVVTMYMSVSTSASIASGGDIGVVQVNSSNTGLYPTASGGVFVGYVGARAIIGSMNASGAMTIRNASASSIGSGTAIGLRGTYICVG